MSNSLGRYEIIEVLGRGAMGVVYKARDPLLSRTVAIKTMPEMAIESQDLRLRLEREAAAGARLDHPNIVSVHDFGKHRGVPFIAMEYLEGYDLKLLIANKVPLRPATILGILLQIARGMRHAHASGVIHRDIKPANIRVLADGRVKIMDFGIAHVASSELTAAGSIMGSIAYMSPEQISGHRTDKRCDVFAFGVLAYELLARRLPFSAVGIPATLNRILRHDPDPLPAQRLIPFPELEVVITRCLAKQPEERYSDFDQISRALEAVRYTLGPNATITEDTFVPTLSATFDGGDDGRQGDNQYQKKTVFLGESVRSEEGPGDDKDDSPAAVGVLEAATTLHERAALASHAATDFYRPWTKEADAVARPVSPVSRGARASGRPWGRWTVSVLAVCLLAATLWRMRSIEPPASTTSPKPIAEAVVSNLSVDASSDAIERAQRLSDASDFRGAVTVLESHLAASPGDNAARSGLETARHELAREFDSRARLVALRLETDDWIGAIRDGATALFLEPGDPRILSLFTTLLTKMHPRARDGSAQALIARELERASDARTARRRQDMLDALGRARFAQIMVDSDFPQGRIVRGREDDPVGRFMAMAGVEESELGLIGLSRNVFPQIVIRVSSELGVMIYLDERLVGEIDGRGVLEMEVTDGTHLLRYEVPNYLFYEEQIRVGDAEPNAFEHEFPRPGKLQIHSDPPALVELNGEDLGTTPVSLSAFPEGEHELVLRLEGYAAQRKRVVVRHSQDNLFNFVLPADSVTAVPDLQRPAEALGSSERRF